MLNEWIFLHSIFLRKPVVDNQAVWWHVTYLGSTLAFSNKLTKMKEGQLSELQATVAHEQTGKESERCFNLKPLDISPNLLMLEKQSIQSCWKIFRRKFFVHVLFPFHLRWSSSRRGQSLPCFVTNGRQWELVWIWILGWLKPILKISVNHSGPNRWTSRFLTIKIKSVAPAVR